MRSNLVRLVLVAAAALALGAVPVFATVSSSGQPLNYLPAGHTLTADPSSVETATNSLVSQNGEFHLRVFSERIQLDQQAQLNVDQGTATATIWSRSDASGVYRGRYDATTLRMQTDGNLVLRTGSGHVLWASNTVGTGTQNYIALSSGGDLYMFTSAHREVWSSGTSGIFLPSGESLFSGQTLGDRRGDQFPGWVESTLSMRADGNLVYACGGKILWQSHTFSPGAYVTMQSDGNLVVYSLGTSRRALWASHTVNRYPFTYLDSAQMKLLSPQGDTQWAAGLPTDNACS